ncbi:MAG: hypothetical protein MUE83_02655 [Tabrizicola sp.]|jgi:hypothetical protein|nr:hypothetical protein [Tabrizicola sp.]
MLGDDFRRRQALADLERVCDGDPLTGDASAALDRAAAPDRVWAATAQLLWSALTFGEVDPVLSDVWDQRRSTLLLASPQVRAALMHGYRLLGDHRLAGGIDTLAAEALITLPRQDVEAALIRIGRQMTADDMNHVARADYGCDAARHRAALQILLEDPHLAYPDGEVWYPAEVVEVVSHVPGQPGHVPCLAIVLLNAVRTDDDRGEADYRLANQCDAIVALDPKVKDPFFAAFRYLYERNVHWTSQVPAPFTLPWVSLD